MPWLRSVDEVEFNGEQSFAFLEYRDAGLPVRSRLKPSPPSYRVTWRARHYL
ncbi:MAG: hypothetical protein QXF46_07400 [Thermofilaceae archaeon]